MSPESTFYIPVKLNDKIKNMNQIKQIVLSVLFIKTGKTIFLYCH